MALYDDQMEVGFPGMKLDSGDDRVETFPAGGAIPFGAIVITDPAGAAMADSVSNQPVIVPGAVGTREGQSVVLLGASARSTFRDLGDGRLGA